MGENLLQVPAAPKQTDSSCFLLNKRGGKGMDGGRTRVAIVFYLIGLYFMLEIYYGPQ